MGVVEDFQLDLQTAGIVDESSGWPSVRRVVHDGSDRLVVLTEDGGFEPEPPTNAGLGDIAFEWPAVQIRVRGDQNEGDEAFAKIIEIRDRLHGRQYATIGYSDYIWVKAQSGVIPIGLDERKRPEFTLSFRAMQRITVGFSS